jgi:hypothetical protein
MRHNQHTRRQAGTIVAGTLVIAIAGLGTIVVLTRADEGHDGIRSPTGVRMGVRDRLSAEDDIREAVFWRLLEGRQAQRNGWLLQNPQCCFLGYGAWEDPPAAFLARFNDRGIRVEPVSMASRSLGPVHHQRTGQGGCILFVPDVRWIDDDRAEVTAGYHEGEEGAARGTCLAIHCEGQWLVCGPIGRQVVA